MSEGGRGPALRRLVHFTGGGRECARWGASLVADSQGALVCFGGEDSTGQLTNSLVRLDRESRSVRVLGNPDQKESDIPCPRAEHSCVLHKGSLYVFGGDAGPRHGRLNDMYRFDLESQRWYVVEQRGGLRPEPRCSHSAVMWEECMYVFGGWDWKRGFRELFAFDFRSHTWSKWDLGKDCKVRIRHTAHVGEDGIMYVVCGEDDDMILTNDVFACDLRRKPPSWTKVRNSDDSPFSMMADRYGHTSALIPHQLVNQREKRGTPTSASILVFGGYAGEMNLLSDLWLLDIKKDTNTMECKQVAIDTDGLDGRDGHAGVLCSESFVCVGGRNQNLAVLDEVLELPLKDLNKWPVLDQSSAAAAGGGSAAPWDCGICTYQNSSALQTCAMCTSPRPKVGGHDAPPRDTQPKSSTCGVCTFENAKGMRQCEMCGTVL